MNKEHREFRGMDLHQPFNYGLDSNLPSNPKRGDAFYAYDSLRLYVCSNDGIWSFASFCNKTEEAFQISPDGIISMPKQSSVRVSIGSAEMSLTAGVWTKIVWDQIEWDNQGEMSLVTSSFVPRESGIYLSTGQVVLSLTAGDFVAVGYYINGITYMDSRQDFSTGDQQSYPIIDVLKLNAGDKVTMHVINNTSNDTLKGSNNSNGTGYQTSWCIHKLM